MTGGDVAGVALAVVVAVPLLVRLIGRWQARQWDRHVSLMEAMLRHPSTGPTCDCRGSLRDASGVHHDPVCCMPRRELITKRGAR